MAPPTPPVPLKDHCSIIYNGVLYVYSPTAFLSLPLIPNTQWNEEPNGVSVTGAACVKGGIDGDNTRAALYIVGGSANSSATDYTGLQRYDLQHKQWQTIKPVVAVTQNRLHHGTAYMNASSSIVVYGGSQNNAWHGASTETFLIELYPPYRVQAYSSVAPPVIDPIMLSWSNDHAVMVGGGSTNTEVWTFGPADGWQNIGLALPNALPDRKSAQCALFTLDDASKVLETFDLSQSPGVVTTNVLLNPGGLPAAFNETAGSPSTTTTLATSTSGPAAKPKRSTFLSNFPPYSSQFAPSGTRSGFSLAQDDSGLVTIVGGDSDNSIVVFNGTGDAWLDANKVVSANPNSTPQKTIGSPTSKVTSSPPSATSSASSSPGFAAKGNGLTILGAVLGGICGLAAILIILLLWLRSVRRKRAHDERVRREVEFPHDKRRASGEPSFEDQSMQPFSRAGQPMGRSPVVSTVVDKETMGVFAEPPIEKPHEVRSSSALGNRLHVNQHRTSFGPAMFKRDKSPLSISRPMAPNLGDYKDRPSIELGRATPAGPVAAAATAGLAGGAVKGVLARNASQRKTDEGWAKYFTADGTARRVNNIPEANRETIASQGSASSGRGGGGFWPGSGVPTNHGRSPKLALRDSSGNALQAQSVTTASPNVENGPFHAKSKALQAVEGIPAHISSGHSTSSAESPGQDDEDDGYEDERIEHAYSSGVPSSIHDHTWTPIGNAWATTQQRQTRPQSSNVSSNYPSGGLPLPTGVSHDTSNSGSGNSSGTKRSSIPSFPMPSSTIRQVIPSAGPSTPLQHVQTPSGQTSRPVSGGRPRPRRPQETGNGYFENVGPGRDGMPMNNNLSWLNLNADNRS